MDQEGFLETVKKQYGDEIQALYMRCERSESGEVDYSKLRDGLGKLMKNAKIEGLSRPLFEDLVESCLSEDVWKKLNLSGQKAA